MNTHCTIITKKEPVKRKKEIGVLKSGLIARAKRRVRKNMPAPRQERYINIQKNK